MNAYKAYKYYIATKAHFETWDYDLIKYKAKTSNTVESFVKRNDALIFESLSNKYGESIGQYYIANFVERFDRFIYDPHASDRIYTEWRLRRAHKDKLISKEILDLPYEHFPDIIKTGSQSPILLKEYISKNISAETIVALDSHFNFLDAWRKTIDKDFLWTSCGITLSKYRSFVTFNEDLVSETIINKFGRM